MQMVKVSDRSFFLSVWSIIQNVLKICQIACMLFAIYYSSTVIYAESFRFWNIVYCTRKALDNILYCIDLFCKGLDFYDKMHVFAFSRKILHYYTFHIEYFITLFCSVRNLLDEKYYIFL